MPCRTDFAVSVSDFPETQDHLHDYVEVGTSFAASLRRGRVDDDSSQEIRERYVTDSCRSSYLTPPERNSLQAKESHFTLMDMESYGEQQQTKTQGDRAADDLEAICDPRCFPCYIEYLLLRNFLVD